MTNSSLHSRQACTPPADRVMCADSVGRALLAMAVPPGHRDAGAVRHVPVLGRRGELPDERRRELIAADAVAQAMPLAQLDHLDAEATASWVVDQYPAQWRSLAAFALDGGQVDGLVSRRYPMLPPAAGHAIRHLGDLAAGARPGPLPVDEALWKLKQAGAAPGVLVL